MNVHLLESDNEMDGAAERPFATEQPRSFELLDRVKSVFAERGFDGASMQDLARAAGMSAGNFYRYFPSKDAIILALVKRDMDQIRDEFASIIAAEAPLEAFRGALDHHMCEGKDDAALWIQIKAAAARHPVIATQMQETEEMISDCITQVFARLTGCDPDEARIAFSAQARVIILLVQEANCRRAGLSCGVQRIDPQVSDLLVRMIEQTVSDVLESGTLLAKPQSGTSRKD